MKARLFSLAVLFAAVACSGGSGSRPDGAGATGAGAAAAHPGPAPATGDAKSPEFDRFVEDFFTARFAFEPTSGTETGLHQYDSTLEDYSRERIAARVHELEELRTRLRGIDRASLGFDDAIDHQALEGQIEAELLDLVTLRVFEVNPMPYTGLAGRAIDSLIKRDFAPAAERLRAVIAREKAVPAVYRAARAAVKNPPREFTEIAIRRAKGSIGFFEGSVATWARSAAGADAGLWKEFEDANRAVVAETKSFATWLEKDLLPRSKGNYAIGEATFLAKLKYEEMVETPLAELLARGEAQLEKDHAAFVEVARAIDGKKSPAAVVAALSRTHPTPERLVPSVKESVEGARGYLVEKGIVTIPSEVRPRIEETPPYARAGGFASMDTPGPFEKSATEAFYYVTPVEKDWTRKHKEEHLRLFNPWVISLITIHEAYPGHYLQFLYAPRFPTRTRKLTFSGTNVEGWAHYCEQMMVDEGFGGDDPRFRLAQLSEALVRDARYVVGIKLHTAGWTVEQGAKLFVDKAFQEPANGYEEARRGTYNPTYLYYTLGKLEIQALRDEYRAKKGASLREFHDAFVSQGGLPIPLVRKILFRE